MLLLTSLLVFQMLTSVPWKQTHVIQTPTVLTLMAAMTAPVTLATQEMDSIAVSSSSLKGMYE